MEDDELCFDPEKMIKKFIIDHRGPYYFIWHEVVDFLCIISSFIYAHFAAYRHSNPEYKYLMIAFEGAFLIDFLMNFILDYPDPKDPKFKSVKNLSMIFSNYLQDSFLRDIIALAPLHLITLKHKRQNLLYIVKLVRLYRGFANFDVMEYLNYYKDKQTKDLE